MTPRLGAFRSSGFTLIELMIAVVIVGLLAMVAFPSFMDAIRKNRRSDAYTSISQIQQAQERFRSSNATYASSITALPTDAPPGLGMSASSRSGYYALTLADITPTSYSVIATGNSGTTQAADGACVRLRVRVVGNNIFYGGADGGAGAYDESSTNRCWSR